AGVVPEGGDSVSIIPAGAAYAHRCRPYRHQPCPRVVTPACSIRGRERLRLLAATPCGPAVGDHPCRRPWPQSVAPVGAWPWVAALAGGLAMASHPYRWPGRG
ncbi:hypothetical protein BHM03_00039372, partial [Ensete ventricosum]